MDKFEKKSRNFFFRNRALWKIYLRCLYDNNNDIIIIIITTIGVPLLSRSILYTFDRHNGLDFNPTIKTHLNGTGHGYWKKKRKNLAHSARTPRRRHNRSLQRVRLCDVRIIHRVSFDVRWPLIRIAINNNRKHSCWWSVKPLRHNFVFFCFLIDRFYRKKKLKKRKPDNHFTRIVSKVILF